MPKKRVLPYIILGILKQNPGFTGKEITYQFKNEIGEFWKASHSQVYPELLVNKVVKMKKRFIIQLLRMVKVF